MGNKLLSYLFCIFTEDDFLQVKFTDKDQKRGVVYDGKKPLEAKHALELASQARVILQFEMFQKLEASMKYSANEMLFNKSKNEEDMIAGKMVLYSLDIFRKKLESISKLEH